MKSSPEERLASAKIIVFRGSVEGAATKHTISAIGPAAHHAALLRSNMFQE